MRRADEELSPALREQVRRNLEAQADLASEFGLLSDAEVARLAGRTSADADRQVGEWREHGRVFVVPTDDGDRFPGYQFDERGVPAPAVADVLAAFGDRLGAWEVGLWFTSSSGWLGGCRPVDLLLTEPDQVALAARRLAVELV